MDLFQAIINIGIPLSVVFYPLYWPLINYTILYPLYRPLKNQFKHQLNQFMHINKP